MAQDQERKEVLTGSETGPTIGAKLLREITEKQPKDAYQPNGLPPIDKSRHTEDVIAALQKRAMQID